MTQLKTRTDQIDEPLMDLLMSFSDFEQFKEMMLFARAHLVATTPKIKSGKAAALGLVDGKGNPSSGADSNKNGVALSISGEAGKIGASDLRHFEACIDQL